MFAQLPTKRPRSLFLVTIAGAALLACVWPVGAFAKQEGQKAAGQKEAEPLTLAALPKGTKLILLDGNFHIVRSYEKKGDRVRYFSVERSAWEELPVALVDWEATARAQADAERARQQSIEKIRELELAERTKNLDVDASIEYAPGKYLPDGPGLWVIENDVPLPLLPVGADFKLDKGRLLTQILVPVPVIPTRHKVQIAGQKAVLRITAPRPEFYIRTEDAHEPELELIRATVKGKVREVQRISSNIVGEKNTQRKTVSVERWPVAKGVFRLTLSQPLEPGEYAVAEILPEGMSLYVWDFGMDAPPVSSKKYP